MDSSSATTPDASTVHRVSAVDMSGDAPTPSGQSPVAEDAQTVIRETPRVESADASVPGWTGSGLTDPRLPAPGSSVPSRVPGLAPRQTPASVTAGLEGQSLNHFHLIQQIGGGGMGAVFRARDEQLGRTVAVKVIPFTQTDPDLQRRFRNEAQSAAKLDHPLIARVFDVGNAGPWHYIVFEYIDGENIRDLVIDHGSLSIDDAVFITCQVAEAIGHASRRGIVHRDIKPSNIILTADGTIKLVDMGLARSENFDTSDDLTASGVTLGTFDYISPEQAHDPRSADIRSDLYSLGCTLFFMLTGSPPFPGGTMLQKLLNHGKAAIPNIRDQRPDASGDLAAILNKMLAKKPGDRYQQSATLVADLQELARREGFRRSAGVPGVELTAESTIWLPVRRHLPWMVAAGLMLVTGGWLELAAWQARRDFQVSVAAGTTTANTQTLPPRQDSRRPDLIADGSPQPDSDLDRARTPRSLAGSSTSPVPAFATGSASPVQPSEFSLAPVEVAADAASMRPPAGAAPLDSLNGEMMPMRRDAPLPPASSPQWPTEPWLAGIDGVRTTGGRDPRDLNDPLVGPPPRNDQPSVGPPAGGALSADSLSSAGQVVPPRPATMTNDAFAGGNPVPGGPNTELPGLGPFPMGPFPMVPLSASGLGADSSSSTDATKSAARASDPPSLRGFPLPMDPVNLTRPPIGMVPGPSTGPSAMLDRAAAASSRDVGPITSPPIVSPRVVAAPRGIRVVGEGNDDPQAVSRAVSRADADGVLPVASLEQAILQAEMLGINRIELAVSRLRTDPIVIRRSDLFITSTVPGGTLIEFRSPDEVDMQRSDMLRIGNHPIEFANLHFAWTVPATETDGGSLMAVSENRRVRLSNCTITIDNPSRRDSIFAFHVRADADAGNSSAASMPDAASALSLVSIELENSIVRGQISLLKMETAIELQLRWENGLLAVSRRMIETGGSVLRPRPTSGAIQLSLVQLTAMVPQGLVRMQLNSFTPFPVTIERSAEKSVFVVDRGNPHVEISGLGRDQRDGQWFKLLGSANSYETDSTLADPLLVVRDVFGQSQTTTMNDLLAAEAPDWADERTPRWVVRWSQPLRRDTAASDWLPADFRQDGSLVGGFEERGLPRLPMKSAFDFAPSG